MIPPARSALTVTLICSSLASSLAAVAAAQEEAFTTGPPRGSVAPARKPPGPTLASSSGGGSQRSDSDGDDLRVNQDRAGAQNETSLAIHPGDPDSWVGVANDYRSGGPEVGWFSTRDDGASFTTGTFGPEPGFAATGDPCVVITPDGVIVAACIHYQGPGGDAVFSYRSVDGGQSWQPAMELDRQFGVDKPQIDVDRSAGPHRGDVCVAWNRFGSGDVFVSTSSDGGGSWSAAQRINDDTSRRTIAPDVAYGANSTLSVAWADGGNLGIWLDRSVDGGLRWGTDRLVATYVPVPSPIPGSDFRVFDAFALAADWTDGPYSGALYLACHTWRRGRQHADVNCCASHDGGLLWTCTVVHDDGPGHFDQVMPGAVVDPQGNVDVCYYDRRLDPANQLLWTWLSRSSDGGQSWREHQVSDVGWDHRRTEFPDFIGDYIDVDASGRRVQPFWCDGRADGTQDVYTDRMRVDLFTDVDALSAATGGVVHFTLNVGPNLAGAPYFLLGGTSGTDPGVVFGNGDHLALNADAFTAFTFTEANGSVLQEFQGTLDATGSASPRLDSQGPFDPGLAGLALDFAALVFDGSPRYASGATRVTLGL